MMYNAYSTVLKHQDTGILLQISSNNWKTDALLDKSFKFSICNHKHSCLFVYMYVQVLHNAWICYVHLW